MMKSFWNTAGFLLRLELTVIEDVLSNFSKRKKVDELYQSLSNNYRITK